MVRALAAPSGAAASAVAVGAGAAIDKTPMSPYRWNHEGRIPLSFLRSGGSGRVRQDVQAASDAMFGEGRAPALVLKRVARVQPVAPRIDGEVQDFCDPWLFQQELPLRDQCRNQRRFA